MERKRDAESNGHTYTQDNGRNIENNGGTLKKNTSFIKELRNQRSVWTKLV